MTEEEKVLNNFKSKTKTYAYFSL